MGTCQGLCLSQQNRPDFNLPIVQKNTLKISDDAVKHDSVTMAEYNDLSEEMDRRFAIPSLVAMGKDQINRIPQSSQEAEDIAVEIPIPSENRMQVRLNRFLEEMLDSDPSMPKSIRSANLHSSDSMKQKSAGSQQSYMTVQIFKNRIIVKSHVGAFQSTSAQTKTGEQQGILKKSRISSGEDVKSRVSSGKSVRFQRGTMFHKPSRYKRRRRYDL